MVFAWSIIMNVVIVVNKHSFAYGTHALHLD